MIDKREMQIEHTMNLAIEMFSDEAKRLFLEEDNYYEEDPSWWADMDDADEMFEAVINDEYWVIKWSVFLVVMLSDEMADNETLRFLYN